MANYITVFGPNVKLLTIVKVHQCCLLDHMYFVLLCTVCLNHQLYRIVEPSFSRQEGKFFFSENN